MEIDMNKANKFSDDFIANNPSEFKNHEEEIKIKDWLEKAYIAGSKGCTYTELGYYLAELQFESLLKRVSNEPSNIKLTKTVKQIEDEMDDVYARYISMHPEAEISRLTVIINKADFKVLEDYALGRYRNSGNSNTPRLTGWSTHNGPWGFKLTYRDDVISPIVVVDV